MRPSYIKAIEYYLTDKVLSNMHLSELYPEWTAEKIENKTGIKERRIANEEETSLDMGEKAALQLFEKSKLCLEDVDFVLFVTETPDYILPASACVLHGRLGLSELCGAFDINLGCSGYVYGLMVAKGLISSGIANDVLLITADTYSKIIHPLDKSTETLFGDAAAATWVSTDGEYEIVDFDCGSRGSDFDKLIVYAGMFRLPKSESTSVLKEDDDGYSRTQENVYMCGADIMSFSIDVVPKSVNRLLKNNKLSLEDIDRFIFHQANAFMLNYLKKKLNIVDDKFEMSFEDVGNTVSASIPIALKRAVCRGSLSSAKQLVLSGFGVGLSWGTALLRKNDSKC